MSPDLPLHDHGRRVRALAGTLTRLGIALSLADAEREQDQLVEQIEAVTACVAEAEAEDLCDVRAKLVVLRHRLEEQLGGGMPSESLTVALAASLLRDVERLAA
jgi:hypothetical protein